MVATRRLAASRVGQRSLRRARGVRPRRGARPGPRTSMTGSSIRRTSQASRTPGT